MCCYTNSDLVDLPAHCASRNSGGRLAYRYRHTFIQPCLFRIGRGRGVVLNGLLSNSKLMTYVSQKAARRPTPVRRNTHQQLLDERAYCGQTEHWFLIMSWSATSFDD
jgi:hypothetical protein